MELVGFMVGANVEAMKMEDICFLRSHVRFPMRSLNFSIHLILPALGSTQPLAEMSTRNLPGDKGRPARWADNLTAICEPIV
jgi:hypothetical protein